MNSIHIVGRLCADPELRRTTDGTAVCTYSLAVKRPKVKDTTDFINCVTWRQAAEFLSQYGHKGDAVAVTGILQSRKWQDKDGNNRTAWEVVTESVELLSSRKNSEGTGNTTPAQSSRPGGNGYGQQGFGGYEQMDDDDPKLPF